MDLVEEEEVADTAAGTVVAINQADMEAAATVAAIMDLITLTLINILEQNGGKTEVMELLFVVFLIR